MFHTFEHAESKEDYDLLYEVAKATKHYNETGAVSTVKIPTGTHQFNVLRITCPMILVGQGETVRQTKLHGAIIIGNKNPMKTYQTNGAAYQRFQGIPEPGVQLEKMQITNKTGGNGPAVSVSNSVCVLESVRITNCKDDGLVASSVDDDPMRVFMFKTTQAVVRCHNVKVTKCQGSGIEANGTALIVLKGEHTEVTRNCKGGHEFDFGLKVDTYYKAAIHIKNPLTLKGVSHDNGGNEAKNFGVGQNGGDINNIKVIN